MAHGFRLTYLSGHFCRLFIRVAPRGGGYTFGFPCCASLPSSCGSDMGMEHGLRYTTPLFGFAGIASFADTPSFGLAHFCGT
jgi:hypothetical protein